MDKAKNTRLVLIGLEYSKDSIGQSIPRETRRQVYCNTSGITRSEWSAAGQQGLKPSAKVSVYANEYHGEIVAELGGKKYDIYRVYPTKGDMELYLSAKTGD